MSLTLATAHRRPAVALGLLAVVAPVAGLFSLPVLASAGAFLLAGTDDSIVTAASAVTARVVLGVGVAPWLSMIVLPVALRRLGRTWGRALLATATTLAVLIPAELVAGVVWFGGV